MPRTRYVTTIRLDADPLTKDLEHTATFRYSEAYSDYLIGGPWKDCVLWAALGGDSGDAVDLTRLNFVRLVPIASTVIIPHRDLLELTDLPENGRNAHRVHIPLITNDNGFFSEANTAYRMKEGDIWFLDASQIHSVASFSNQPPSTPSSTSSHPPATTPLSTVTETTTTPP